MSRLAAIKPWAMSRDQLMLRIAELERQVASGQTHVEKGVGELAAAVAKTAERAGARAERQHIAEWLRAEARQVSRKTAGYLRIVANMIEEAS